MHTFIQISTYTHSQYIYIYIYIYTVLYSLSYMYMRMCVLGYMGVCVNNTWCTMRKTNACTKIYKQKWECELSMIAENGVEWVKYYLLLTTKDGPSHSVESPSMVDPQWNIWYWGSKWNLHTVCWSAVGCEWGTTSVYFGITYVCFIPSRLPVFAVEPQCPLQYFLFLSKVSFELHIQNLQKISCWFKIWMGFVGPILFKLWTSSIWGFL